MDGSVDPQAVIQKMAVKVANMEVRNSMLEVALETAREEIARLTSDASKAPS
jgi:hypothetical protein